MSCTWDMSPVMCREQLLSTYQGLATFLRNCPYTMNGIIQFWEPSSSQSWVDSFLLQVFHLILSLLLNWRVMEIDLTKILESIESQVSKICEFALNWWIFYFKSQKILSCSLTNSTQAQPELILANFCCFYEKPVYSFEIF